MIFIAFVFIRFPNSQNIRINVFCIFVINKSQMQSRLFIEIHAVY